LRTAAGAVDRDKGAVLEEVRGARHA
jgi:hypothetical protein